MTTKVKAKISIRTMEPEDISGVLEIDQKLTGVKRAPTYSDLKAGDLGGALDLSFIAEADNNVVGFVMGRHAYLEDPPEDIGLVQIMGIHPYYQRQGIATKLINSMVAKCKAKGIKTVRFIVNETDGQMQELLTGLSFNRGHSVDYNLKV
ncbi:MAG: GNAT family N-acetyltransferase [Chloroflexi bacterium]|nr:GNAT family N-acetyltransferase [Chloroflexota bacterium]